MCIYPPPHTHTHHCRCVIIWSTASAQPLRKLRGHTLIVTSVSLSQDNCTLVSTSNDADIGSGTCGAHRP